MLVDVIVYGDWDLATALRANWCVITAYVTTQTTYMLHMLPISPEWTDDC